MKELIKKNASLVVLMALVSVTALFPELALAQDNPFLSGMRNGAVIRIAQIVLYAAAFVLFAGEGIPALKDQDMKSIMKVGFGVAILVAGAVKLKEIVDLFANIA